MKITIRCASLLALILLSSCASVRPDKAADLIPPKPFIYKNVEYAHPAFAMFANGDLIDFPYHFKRGAYLRMSERQKSDAKTYIDAWERCYVTTINLRRSPPALTEENYRRCGVMLDVMFRIYKQGYDWSQNVGFWGIGQLGNTDFITLVQKHQACLEEDLIGNAAINPEGSLGFFCDPG